MKIKIFNTCTNKPKDAEDIMQKWLDELGNNFVIKHVCHSFIDSEHVIQTLFLYEEVPVTKQIQT